jgi:hypothetical protein
LVEAYSIVVLFRDPDRHITATIVHTLLPQTRREHGPLGTCRALGT